MRFHIIPRLDLIVTESGYLWEGTGLPGGCAIGPAESEDAFLSRCYKANIEHNYTALDGVEVHECRDEEIL